MICKKCGKRLSRPVDRFGIQGEEICRRCFDNTIPRNMTEAETDDWARKMAQADVARVMAMFPSEGAQDDG